MNKLYILYPVLCFFLFACSGGDTGEGTSASTSGPTELSLRTAASDTIGTVGEVDWYHYRAVEANSILQIRCTSNTLRPDVDLLVTVFELDANGNKVRLYGDHATEGSLTPADIKMNIYIDRPKDIYISVRDLMDDEASGNSYQLIVDFAGSSDGDGNFTSATSLPLNNTANPHVGDIGFIGDIDCFNFTIGADGVYAVNVDFNEFVGGSEVRLNVEVYDGNGNLVQSSTDDLSQHRLLSSLTAGQYFVLIKDSGMDDFDQMSTYEISVQSVASTEASANDNLADADVVGFAQIVNGSLDYAIDQDWHMFSLSGPQVVDISFLDQSGLSEFSYQVMLVDAAGTALLSHDYVASTAPYETQIMVAEAGDYYLVAQGAVGQLITGLTPYEFSIAVHDVNDDAETDGNGNDTINTAMDFANSNNGEYVGKVSFRGDNDWYSIATTQGQVMEMFLETTNPTRVDYSVSIMQGSQLDKVFDNNGSDGPTQLKTSLYIQSSGTNYFKVADAQLDEGDGDPSLSYSIRGNMVSIPTTLPAATWPAGVNSNADYFYAFETDEQAGSASDSITLRHTGSVSDIFKANKSVLQFHEPGAAQGITRTTTNGLTTINFPWIGGYVDYQRDQDWFELDLGALDQGTDTTWYYEIQVEMHVGAPDQNSPDVPVEYVWKMYRDAHDDGTMMDRTIAMSDNGYFASNGDVDTADQAFDVTSASTAETPFYIGNNWGANKIYLSVSDKIYDVDEVCRNCQPDDDWGFRTPYYYRLKLIYHPGVSDPE